jgi:hypothetical protein
VGHHPHSGASSCESLLTHRDRCRRQSVATNRPASSMQVHPVSTKSSGDGIKYFAAQAFAMHPYFTSHCIPSACIQPHGPYTCLYTHFHFNIAIIAIMSCIMSGKDFSRQCILQAQGSVVALAVVGFRAL